MTSTMLVEDRLERKWNLSCFSLSLSMSRLFKESAYILISMPTECGFSVFTNNTPSGPLKGTISDRVSKQYAVFPCRSTGLIISIQLAPNKNLFLSSSVDPSVAPCKAFWFNLTVLKRLLFDSLSVFNFRRRQLISLSRTCSPSLVL